jgi:hypothetical protein
MTPIDTGLPLNMTNPFLFDQNNAPSQAPPKLSLNKFASQEVTGSKMNSKFFHSCNSLPAIRNISEYYASGASESSVFDGNDSAVTSSLDLSFDADGNPQFDNISLNEDKNPNGDDKDNSEEVPVAKKKRMKRVGVKKKSGF